MIDTPPILQSDARRTAVIRFTIPHARIAEVMGPAIGEVMQAVAAQGIAPSGPVFCHYFQIGPEVFDHEVDVPVSTPIAAAARVQPGELRAAQVARTVYRGPYEGLGEAWGAFDRWIASEELATADDLWEYTAGPWRIGPIGSLAAAVSGLGYSRGPRKIRHTP